MASLSIQQSLELYKTMSSVRDFKVFMTSLSLSQVGGGDGIGLALVKAIVEFGGHVAVIGQREIPHADLRDIQDSSGESSVRYFRADIANELLLNIAFDQILAEFGRIDGVIACAGICIEKPFVEQTWEDVVRLHMVNSVGLFFTVQLAGNVVLIGSIATDGAVESQGLTAYSASKGSGKGLLHSLAVELAPKGIRWQTRPELETIMKSAVPMGRMADRRDLKGAAVYLLSGASLYTTGSNLVISGGIHAGRL
ncbi:putative short-chain dehydrogenase [Aspergillus cavernicola]|uniref:Short-chain dehydrogenase n=1 Tax=Aspergillus cavernicola TaxID=176166 RepID=A0ABR4J1R2_9EURO